MKLSIPETPDEYFAETEFAARHAYEGMAACWSVYVEAMKYFPHPVKEGNLMVISPPKTVEEHERSARCSELFDKYGELKFSEAMLAGSIFQIAYTALALYSRNETLPPSCSFVPVSNKSAVRCCVGKERHGLPIGLIIFAARNQFNHLDMGPELREVNQRVFHALTLAFWDDPFSDLAFDLSNPCIPIYAWEILFTALRWQTYEQYLAGMKELPLHPRAGA